MRNVPSSSPEPGVGSVRLQVMIPTLGTFLREINVLTAVFALTKRAMTGKFRLLLDGVGQRPLLNARVTRRKCVVFCRRKAEPTRWGIRSITPFQSSETLSMKRLFHILAFTLACIASVAGCSRPGADQGRGEDNVPTPSLRADTGQICLPTFTAVAPEPIEVWSGHWKFGVDAFLIGCEAELASLSSSDRNLVAQRLRQVVEEEGLPFFMRHQTPEFRKRFVKEAGEELTRKAFNDVVVVSRYSIEHEPVLPDR